MIGLGIGLLRKFGGSGAICNATTYTNTTTGETVYVSFVPCGQLYSFGELITSFNHNISGIEV